MRRKRIEQENPDGKPEAFKIGQHVSAAQDSPLAKGIAFMLEAARLQAERAISASQDRTINKLH